MNLFRKKNLLPAALILVFMFITFSPAFARVVSNYLGSAYENQGGNRVAVGPIEIRIVNGAAFFLESYSNYLSFLHGVELWDLYPGDATQLGVSLDKSISNLELALKEYGELLEISAETPYNQQAAALLKDFDFDGFMRANNLLPGIFKDVEKYLKKADIKGVSEDLSCEFSKILLGLTILKSDLDLSHLPGPRELLKLQGSYSRALLFGQYTAAVLYEIKENM